MFRCLSVNPISVRVIVYMKLVVFYVVRGIFFPAAQLFVVAIENILRGAVGNLISSVQLSGGG